MADAGAAALPACTDVPQLSPPETVALAGGRAALLDARRHRCTQARSQPGGQPAGSHHPDMSLCGSLTVQSRPADAAGIPGRAPSTGDPHVHRLFPPGRLASLGSYAHAGSAEGAVTHSLSLVMHVAVHKTARVPCSGWPGNACLAFRVRRVRPGRGAVPPEWEECGGHQAGAEACLAEQAG